MTVSLPRSLPRVLVAALLALLAVLAAAAPAQAHASLVESTPVDRAVLDEAPTEVTFAFSEAVSTTTGGMRVFNAAGERADTGEQTQPSPDTLVVALKPGLAQGTYIASARVLSDDGHVVRIAILFSIGVEEPIDEASLATLGTGSDGALPFVAALLRWLAYAGAMLAAGGAVWILRMPDGPGELERARRVVNLAVAVTTVATVLELPVQAMLASGLGVAALTGPPLFETIASSVGVAALARIFFLTALALLLALLPGARRTWFSASLLVLATFLVDGHTRTVHPIWLMMTADSVHLLAGAVWGGGLLLLAASLRARRHADDPVGAASYVSAFSRLATWALIGVAVAGAAMSWALVRQPRALTSTDYGWTLLVKVSLVGVLALVGGFNQRQLVPAIVRVDDLEGAGAAFARLRRTVSWEVGLIAAVLVATSVLVNLRPAAEAAGITAAFDTTVAVTDELSLNLVVDPNRAGLNDLHLYVFDATGRPTSSIEEVTLRLSQPDRDIGPIVRTPLVAGPGHWQLTGRELAIAAAWTIEIELAIDRFTVETAEVTVHVNPS